MMFIAYLLVVYTTVSLLIGLFITSRLDDGRYCYPNSFNRKDRWELVVEFLGCWISFALVWPLMVIAVLTERK